MFDITFPLLSLWSIIYFQPNLQISWEFTASLSLSLSLIVWTMTKFLTSYPASSFSLSIHTFIFPTEVHFLSYEHVILQSPLWLLLEIKENKTQLLEGVWCGWLTLKQRFIMQCYKGYNHNINKLLWEHWERCGRSMWKDVEEGCGKNCLFCRERQERLKS